jgi:N-acyl-D-aspartate/D-glutamate deacylase
MGGYYDTHLRDENSYNIGLKAAVAEAIQISREAEIPVSISHIKCLGRGVWGQAPQIIEIVRQARTNGLKVAANQYPYEASGTSFDAAVLPNWAAEDGRKQLLARIADPPTHARLLKEIPPLIEKRGGPASLVLIGYAADPSLKGKSLQDIAAMWHVEPAEAVLRIIRGGPTSVVSHNMQESDIVVFMKQDWVATASDGESALPAQLTHPRSFGTFAVKIEKYVEAEHVISLPFAIRAATSLPASIARLKERGTIAVGNYADIVVFDPTRVHSPATYTDPAQYAQGFVHVLVNGRFAIENGKPTHVLAGRVLRGPATDKTLLAAGPSR